MAVKGTESATLLRLNPDKKKSNIKVISSKLRWWRRFGINHPDEVKKMILLLESPEVSLMDYRLTIDQIEILAKKSDDPKVFDILGKQKAQWHKLVHGETKNINAEVNVFNWSKIGNAYQDYKKQEAIPMRDELLDFSEDDEEKEEEEKQNLKDLKYFEELDGLKDKPANIPLLEDLDIPVESTEGSFLDDIEDEDIY